MMGNYAFSQKFTHADTLRGSNGKARSWWDATKYNLHVKFDLEDSSISGYNIISLQNISGYPTRSSLCNTKYRKYKRGGVRNLWFGQCFE